MISPTELAEMEAVCFPNASAHWTAEQYAQHMGSRGQITVADEAGFIVGRVAADEAEIISLGVLPDQRKDGHGTELLARFEKAALDQKANVIFLEVSAQNKAALALYKSREFLRVGRRRKYYENDQGVAVDAFILKKMLHET